MNTPQDDDANRPTVDGDDSPAGSIRPEKKAGVDAEPKSSTAKKSSMPLAEARRSMWDIPRTPLQSKYEFLSVLGAGGAGVIYKARQLPLGRLVAVKMVHSHVSSEVALKRFYQEAKTISNLSHPNIIGVYDFGISEEEQPFMIMDYVEGCPLSDMVDEMVIMPPALVTDFMSQLCDGLTHAHQHGIIHRDLKPSNVMLLTLESGNQVLKILDFGLAKLLFGEEGESEHLTKTGETVGTPAFMSPEQVMGREMDERSDLYSVGCMMYHCLTGEPPFVGETKMETMLMQLNTEPKPINAPDGEPLIPYPLETIVLKLLHKDPARRFQSATELKTALEYYDKGLFISATEQTAEPAEEITEEIADRSKQEPQISKEEDKRSLLPPVRKTVRNHLPLVLGLLFSIGGGIAFLYYQFYQSGAFNEQYSRLKSMSEKSETAEVEGEKTTKAKTRDDLYYDRQRYTDEEFAGIIQRNLDKPSISSEGAAISDSVLQELKKASKLEQLNLANSPIGSEGLRHLEGLAITHLDLKATKIDDQSMESISKLKNLTNLDISENMISDRGLSLLSRLPALVYLDASGTKLSDKGTASLAELVRLETLNLSGTTITDNSADSLKKLSKQLLSLDLSNTEVSDLALEALQNHKSLAKLNLAGTKIGDKGVSFLTGLPSLVSLDLSRTDIDDKAVPSLMKLDGLTRLRLLKTNISRKAIKDFQRSNPTCFLDMEPES